MTTPTVGDRYAAQEALRVHLANGRLEPGEYESRQVAADRAQDWPSLEALFVDLPSPRVARTGDYGSPEGIAYDQTVSEPAQGQQVMVPRTYPINPPLRTDQASAPSLPRWLLLRGPLVVVLLFLLTRQWQVLLLIPLWVVFIDLPRRRR